MQIADERQDVAESRISAGRLAEQSGQEIRWPELNRVTAEMRKADIFKDYPGGRFESFFFKD